MSVTGIPLRGRRFTKGFIPTVCPEATRAFQRSPGEAFEWVKFRSHLSRGVTVGTMLQDEAFHFLRNVELDARNFFSPEPENLKRNQFGVGIGGPSFDNRQRVNLAGRPAFGFGRVPPTLISPGLTSTGFSRGGA